MKLRRLAILSTALLLGAPLVACSDDGANKQANNGALDAGSDATNDDTGSDIGEQDAGDAGPTDAGDTDEENDASDAGDVEDDTSDADPSDADPSDAGDAEDDVQDDVEEDVDPQPQPDDLDPTGGQWSRDYAMPGLQGQSGARGYVLEDDPGSDGFYVGGIFEVAGGSTASNVAWWNGTMWVELGYSLSIDVHALEADANGNLYAGGAGGGGGIGIGGSNAIEKWDGTSWTQWADIGGGFGATVYDIEILSDGRILIGGSFGTVANQSIDNLAVYDGQSWSAFGNGDSPDGGVRDIVEMSDGRICIGGDFMNVGQLSAGRVACWDGTQWAALGGGMNSGVEVLLEDSGELLAGGFFSVTDASGATSIGLARWDGTQWQGVANGVHGGAVTSVRALAHGPGGELFVGGTFSAANGSSVPASNIAVLDNGQWSALGSGVQNTVGIAHGSVIGINDLLVGDGGSSLISTGLFSQVGGQFSLNIAKWQVGATDDTGWSKIVGGGEFAGADSSVVSLAASPSGVVYAAGQFTTIGSQLIEGVAQWENGRWRALSDQLSGDVVEIVVDSSGRAYFGGQFTLATSSQNIFNLAIWDGASWTAPASTPPGSIVAMTMDENDKLYIATTAGSGGSFFVHEWTGSGWQQIGDAFSQTILAMEVLPGGDLYVGGQFTEDLNGNSLAGIARWDGSSWVEVGGGVGENDYVTDLAIYDGKLLVLGNMDELGGQPASAVALWDGAAWDTLGGGIPSQYANSPAPTALAAATKANGFFVTGTFSTIGQQTVNYITWWDGQSWHPLGAGLSDLAEAMAIADHRLFVGGPFTEAGGHPSYHIGEWSYQSAAP